MSLWSVEARKRALRAVYHVDGLEVGLVKSDWQHGPEEAFAGYTRQQIKFGEPKVEEDGAVTVASTQQIVFPPYPTESDTMLVGWVVYHGKKELARGELRHPLRPPAGLQIVFLMGDLSIGLAGRKRGNL